MQEILPRPHPYGLIKEADGLITTVNAVNSALLTGRRKQAIEKIDGHYATLTKDMATVQGDAGLRAACLKPLELLQATGRAGRKPAHITQAEAEAIKEFDAAIARIEEFVKQAEQSRRPRGPATPPPVVKKQRIVKPADFVKTTYLETPEDVNGFLDALRQELEKAFGQQRTHPDSVRTAMNRTKLKNYAPQARRDFIQAVTDRAAFYGLTAKKIEPVVEKGDVC